MVNQLLAKLDGVEELNNILVVGTRASACGVLQMKDSVDLASAWTTGFRDVLSAVIRCTRQHASTPGRQHASRFAGFELTNALRCPGLTNRPELVDPALLRPGRLEVRSY